MSIPTPDTLRRITRWLQEAAEENKAAKDLWLLRALDHATVVQVGDHISQVEMLLANALSHLPPLPEQVRDEQIYESEQEALAKSEYANPIFWQGQRKGE